MDETDTQVAEELRERIRRLEAHVGVTDRELRWKEYIDEVGVPYKAELVNWGVNAESCWAEFDMEGLPKKSAFKTSVWGVHTVGPVDENTIRVKARAPDDFE